MARVNVWETMNDGIRRQDMDRIFSDEESPKKKKKRKSYLKMVRFKVKILNNWVRNGQIENSSQD
jgi:hypothetical protein